MEPSGDFEFGNWRVLFLGVGALLCLVFFIGYSVPHTQAPAPPHSAPAPNTDASDARPDYVDQPEKAAERVDVLARQSKGDLSSLSSADQRWLDAATAGHAQEFISKRARYLNAEADRSKRSTRLKVKHP